MPFGFIIVYDVKRFGRVDNDEAGYYRHLLRVHGVEVLYATEGFDGGEADDLLRPVKQWQARQESRDLSKVTIRGLVSKFGSTSPAPGSSGAETSSTSGAASGKAQVAPERPGAVFLCLRASGSYGGTGLGCNVELDACPDP